MHIQGFTKTLKITVGCPPCTYPSIHVETQHISKHSHKNLQTCWTPWYARSIITSKFSVACAAAVVDDERDHFLFRHCWQCEQDGKQGFRQKWLLKVSSRRGLWLRRRRLMSSIPLLFRSCSMKTSLANDFAVVRLETKEGPFHYRNISGEEFIFYYSFKLIPKTAAGENYSHYSFILIPKQ